MSDTGNGAKPNGESPRRAGNGRMDAPMPPPVKKPKRKRSLVFRVVMTFVIVLGSFLVLSTAAIVGYSYVMNGRPVDGTNGEIAEKRDLWADIINSVGSIGEMFSPVPTRTNFLLMGIDNDGSSKRSDAIMVGTFNSKTKELSLISVPRDTYIVLPQDRLDFLRSNRSKSTPETMKINAIYAYGGRTYGPEFLRLQLEEMLSISIQYYVLVELDGFEFLIDAIDGVYFNVPQKMFYEDPLEDLYIDLKPGYQRLMGHDAIGLVRFRQGNEGDKTTRSYPSADLERITVQQAFMKAAISQATAKENLFANAGALLETMLQYVETDITLPELLKYLSFIKDIDPDNISTYSLKGEGGNYFYPDTAANAELIQKVFYGQGE